MPGNNTRYVEKNGRYLNAGQLAKALERSPSFVTAMRAAGYVFEFGTATTLVHAENWLRDHPSFRTTSYFRVKKDKVEEVTPAAA